MDAVPKLITLESSHYPPSTNSLFANVAGKGRVRTKRYKDWSSAAGWDLKGKGHIPGPFSIGIILSRKQRRSNADIDNRIKGLLDLIVEHQIVEDDRLCERLSIEYGDCEGWYAEIRPFLIPL